MSDEDFLKRWSRRKRAAEVTPESLPPAPLSDPLEKEVAKPAADTEPKADEEFDISVLPSLDSITANTDVTAFLRKGVPLTLTREALRRAWLADPTIRDFVGLAENAWDFNDPNAMPGFGPLDHTPEQVRDLVARIVGDSRPAAEDDDVNSAAPQPQQDSVMSTDAGSAEAREQKTVIDAAESEIDRLENRVEQAEVGSDAPQKSSDATRAGQTDSFSVVHRTHGSALPQ